MEQADNVRAQLQRQMERLAIDVVSVPESSPSFYTNIRMALVSGYVMQVAHRESGRGRYKTVKDDQVRGRERAGRVISDRAPL
jgi:pre-mRNA-splicing factor ATP-dependent RNA helicase DHX15/PRP43